MNRLPLWMIEGMAEYLSLGRVDPLTAMWMRDAALTGHLPAVAQLNSGDPRYFPYRYGEALWAYIGGRWGDRAVAEVYRFALREGPEAAIRRVLGVSSEQLSRDWMQAVRSAYLPLVQGRQSPADVGRVVLGKNKPQDVNVSPVVSPDGRHVAFFGARGLFSIDLYLADARTGKIVKRLTSPVKDSHLDAISFINSAGSFSPDGKKFAFVVYAQGDNEIAVVDIASASIERRIRVPGVGEVTNPAWSPDGTKILFSGSAGGISDLYVLDLRSGQVRQLTNDRYADLHPAWSPDGRRIAWATDRQANTNFELMTYSPMHVAVMDVDGGNIRLLPGLEEAKEINPQFAPDGRSIYFISDHDGYSDIYRQELDSGQLYQVTRLATGVSGYTALSPALSVSSGTGTLVFSVFQNGGFDVHALDAASAQGTPITPPPAQAATDATTPQTSAPAPAGILPPREALQSSLVYRYLHDPQMGLPAPDVRYAVAPYHSSLALDYVGQPSIGIGTSTFGTMVGGGVSLYFGDMLSNHTLTIAAQAQGAIQDVGGQAFYQNTTRRWNWGVGVGHVPYLTGFSTLRPVLPGEPAPPGADQVLEQFLQRVFIDQAVLYTAYPLNQTQRFEFNAGYTHYGFSTEVRQLFAVGDQVIDERTIDLASPPGLNQAQAGAAFVGDYSFFGFTSPIMGGRYRLEVTPTFGTLAYTQALADYRRYFFKNPFTLAIRALHYGRYGGGAGDSLLAPLNVGYPTLVRGYETTNFDISECGTTFNTTQSCPAFDRLFGTKIAVANLELRVPLFGVPQYGLINLPFLPTEIAPFLDMGLAWGEFAQERLPDGTSTYQKPTLRFARRTDERVPVFSTGITARFNVLGFLVAEVYYAYPFQRPEKGAHFGFNIAPGW
ncbi:MAG: PD40 domain-containing protein [Gemmatimonadetes bacterium]|nr:PD40 domain-containing protein [Gemmatimonadota bacterium]